MECSCFSKDTSRQEGFEHTHLSSDFTAYLIMLQVIISAFPFKEGSEVPSADKYLQATLTGVTVL